MIFRALPVFNAQFLDFLSQTYQHKILEVFTDMLVF